MRETLSMRALRHTEPNLPFWDTAEVWAMDHVDRALVALAPALSTPSTTAFKTAYVPVDSCSMISYRRSYLLPCVLFIVHSLAGVAN